MNSSYRTVPIYMVCGPSITWPGEYIVAIFFTRNEADEYIRNEINPFLYIREQVVFVDDSRSTATE